MEITLNLAWALLTIWMVCMWLRFAPRGITGRRTQFTALAVLILILLPAISITDDLLAARNPAEVDCCARRDHEFTSARSLLPTVAAPPPAAFAGLSFNVPVEAAPGDYVSPSVRPPALATVQNRPPPAA